MVVERDRLVRNVVGSWLEGAGFEVMECSGPSPPTYRCLASDRSSCPLVDGADLIVIDTVLDADDVEEGTPGSELLTYYLSWGKPIIALSHAWEAANTLPDDQVRIVMWPPEKHALLTAVESAA